MQKFWHHTMILCLFFGILGAHRWHTGHKKTAILQACTLGGLLVWWLIDLLAIYHGHFYDINNRPLWKLMERP